MIFKIHRPSPPLLNHLLNILKFVLAALLLLGLSLARSFLLSGPRSRCRLWTGELGSRFFCSADLTTVVIVLCLPLVCPLGASELLSLPLVLPRFPVAVQQIFPFTFGQPPLRVRINIRIVILGETLLLLRFLLLLHEACILHIAGLRSF